MSQATNVPTQLYRWIFDNVPPERCLEYAAGPLDGLVRTGFSYTSAACRFFEMNDGIPRGYGDPDSADGIRLAEVFELHLFGADFDMAWVRRGAVGRLVISADDEVVASGLAIDVCQHFGLPHAEPSAEPVTTIDHEYLLWGTCEEKLGGWSRLGSPRTGSLWVPTEFDVGQRAVLRARQYLRKAVYGNVVFCGDRLMGFGTAASKQELREQTVV
jgi:CRISPR-associated protein (TIGR03984 family)